MGDEPTQTPEFDEYTVVLRGLVRVETAAGERVRYSAPDGAEYVAICLPAFGPDLAHREE